MGLTSIEWIAFILAVLVVVKILSFLLKRKTFLDIKESLYKHETITSLTLLLFAGIVFYYISMELSLVQIFAVCAFAFLLMEAAIVHYFKYLYPLSNKISKEKTPFIVMLEILIWFVLAVLVVISLS